MIYLFLSILITITALVYIAILAIDNFDIDNEVFDIEEEDDETVIF